MRCAPCRSSPSSRSRWCAQLLLHRAVVRHPALQPGSSKGEERGAQLASLQQLSEQSWVAQKISYAKTKSDAVAKLDGSFKPRDKRERQKKNESARGRALLDCQSP